MAHSTPSGPTRRNPAAQAICNALKTLLSTRWLYKIALHLKTMKIQILLKHFSGAKTCVLHTGSMQGTIIHPGQHSVLPYSPSRTPPGQSEKHQTWISRCVTKQEQIQIKLIMSPHKLYEVNDLQKISEKNQSHCLIYALNVTFSNWTSKSCQ